MKELMNENPANSQQAAPAEPAAASPAPVPAPRAGKTPLLPTLLGVLALLASGWLWLQLQQRDSAIERVNAALAAQQAAAMATQEQSALLRQNWQQLESALQAELAAGNARIDAQNEQLAVLERELAALGRRTQDNNRPVTASSRELLFSEAEGLLRLARERLLTARDVPAATRLYIAADELLLQIDDSAAFSVREALARELATLRSLPNVDVQGLYVQLGALAARIDEFHVLSDATADFRVDPSAPEEAADGWYAGISAALQRYFVVSRQDGAVQPLLSTEQEFLIRRGIQLQLEQARLALLRGQSRIWQNVLADAAGASARWLADDGSGNHAQLLATLRELQASPIETDIPALDNTLRVLRQVQQAAGGAAR